MQRTREAIELRTENHKFPKDIITQLAKEHIIILFELLIVNPNFKITDNKQPMVKLTDITDTQGYLNNKAAADNQKHATQAKPQQTTSTTQQVSINRNKPG